jgi:hypothetical protein
MHAKNFVGTSLFKPWFFSLELYIYCEEIKQVDVPPKNKINLVICVNLALDQDEVIKI